jgi:hypothetical protein
MADPSKELATADASTTWQLRSSRALSALLARCPACGAGLLGADTRCLRCGHECDRARWQRIDERPRLRVVGPSSVRGAATAVALGAVVAAAAFRTGISMGSLLSCVGAFAAAATAPLLLVGAKFAARRMTRRRWCYEGPDGALCIASGTVWAVERTEHERRTSSAERPAPDAVADLHEGHASALVERPEIVARMPVSAGAALRGEGRDRAEAAVALAIAIARMQREGSVRLLRSTVARTLVERGERTETERVEFSLAALSRPESTTLGEWLYDGLPKPDADRAVGGYRDSSRERAADRPEKTLDLQRLVRARFEREGSAGSAIDLVRFVRRFVNTTGGWRSAAPALSIEAQQWLAELAASLWMALRDAGRA